MRLPQHARKKKHIKFQEDEEGKRGESQEGICALIFDYFVDLFLGSESVLDPIVQKMAPKITHEDNARLIRPFTIDEFRETIFQMQPDKALRPDGFSPTFYQHFWIQQGAFPQSVNDTSIVLISKVENPRHERPQTYIAMQCM